MTLDPASDTIVFLNVMLAGMAGAALFCAILAAVLDGILMVVAHIVHLIRYLIGREQWLSGLPANSAAPPIAPASLPAKMPANPLPAEGKGVAGGRQRQQPAEIPHAVGSLRQAPDEQPADSLQSAAVENLQSADARVTGGRQPSRLNDSGPPEGVAKGSPTSASDLPVTREPGLPVSPLPVSARGVAKGLHPCSANETGPPEGGAGGLHVLGTGLTDQSAKPRLQSAKPLPVKWRPLETPRPTLPAPVIPDAEAAMRFRIWMLEFGLEQIDRGHGDLIATIDLWELAKRFAAGSEFRIASRDRFFEALRKLPGVRKEENRWVTRLVGARQKRVSYSFQPAIVSNRRAVGS